MTKQQIEKTRIVDALRFAVNTRWYYISALLLTGVLSKLFGSESANQNFSPYWMVFMGVITYSENLYMYFAAKRPAAYTRAQLTYLSLLQIATDTAVMVAIIFFAGGIIAVGFIYLIYQIIISGFYYQNPRYVLAVTAVISLLYGGLIWGQYFGLIPYLPRYNNSFEFELSRNLAAVVPNTFTVITSYFLIGIFISSYVKHFKDKDAKIEQERQKERSLITNLADGLVLFNSSGRVELANRQAEKLLGFRLEEVQGKNVVQLNLGKYPALGSALRAGEGGHDQEIVSPASADTVLKVNKYDINDEDGRFIGTAILARDVSREKFVDRMKSEFITIAGHQLRTPLSAIKGAISLLKSGDYGPVSQDQVHVLSQVAQYNERMIRLVNDFLNVSSIEQGRSEFKLETVDIGDLLREVSGRFAAEAQKKQISFTTEVKNDLSPLELDVYKIKLALGGIIDNAVTYTPKRGRVKIMAEFPDPGRVVISVSDSGIGIPEDQQQKVFGKFFRAGNALLVETEGNGLDLFVAKSIIETHKGRIWFKSQEGAGTTFFVELPTKI